MDDIYREATSPYPSVPAYLETSMPFTETLPCRCVVELRDGHVFAGHCKLGCPNIRRFFEVISTGRLPITVAEFEAAVLAAKSTNLTE